MKKFLLFTILLSLTAFAYGQNSFKKNDIYIEAGGNGGFGSINYERQLSAKPGFGVRLGTGFFLTYNRDPRSMIATTEMLIFIPAGVNYLFKIHGDKSFIDAGLGFTYDGDIGFTWTKYSRVSGMKKDEKGYVAIMPSIGFRHHTKHNFMWRISFTPVVNTIPFEKDSFYPWAGVSFGKRF